MQSHSWLSKGACATHSEEHCTDFRISSKRSTTCSAHMGKLRRPRELTERLQHQSTHRRSPAPRQQPCTPAAARAGSGIVPQVTQAQSHRGSEQPGAGTRGTRLHAGDAAGGETRGHSLPIHRGSNMRMAVRSHRALQIPRAAQLPGSAAIPLCEEGRNDICRLEHRA